MLKRKKLAKLHRLRLKNQQEPEQKIVRHKKIRRQSSEEWRKEYLQIFEGCSFVQSSLERIAGPGIKKTVFNSKWKELYPDNEEMKEREKAAMIEADKKAKNIAPLYNKGNYVYIGGKSKEDLLTLGKKI